MKNVLDIHRIYNRIIKIILKGPYFYGPFIMQELLHRKGGIAILPAIA